MADSAYGSDGRCHRRFIVDFLCFSRRLIIEVDGAVHDARRVVDEQRDRTLAALRWRILRVRNEDVLTDLDAVLGESSTTWRPERLTSPPPHSWGGARGGVESRGLSQRRERSDQRPASALSRCSRATSAHVPLGSRSRYLRQCGARAPALADLLPGHRQVEVRVGEARVALERPLEVRRGPAGVAALEHDVAEVVVRLGLPERRPRSRGGRGPRRRARRRGGSGCCRGWCTRWPASDRGGWPGRRAPPPGRRSPGPRRARSPGRRDRRPSARAPGSSPGAGRARRRRAAPAPGSRAPSAR